MKLITFYVCAFTISLGSYLTSIKKPEIVLSGKEYPIFMGEMEFKTSACFPLPECPTQDF